MGLGDGEAEGEQEEEGEGEAEAEEDGVLREEVVGGVEPLEGGEEVGEGLEYEEEVEGEAEGAGDSAVDHDVFECVREELACVVHGILIMARI